MRLAQPRSHDCEGFVLENGIVELTVPTVEGRHREDSLPRLAAWGQIPADCANRNVLVQLPSAVGTMPAMRPLRAGATPQLSCPLYLLTFFTASSITSKTSFGLESIAT